MPKKLAHKVGVFFTTKCIYVFFFVHAYTRELTVMFNSYECLDCRRVCVLALRSEASNVPRDWKDEAHMPTHARVCSTFPRPCDRYTRRNFADSTYLPSGTFFTMEVIHFGSRTSRIFISSSPLWEIHKANPCTLKQYKKLHIYQVLRLCHVHFSSLNKPRGTRTSLGKNSTR